MPLENSPSLDNFNSGLPDDITEPTSKSNMTKIMIFSLLGLICILGLLSFIKNNQIYPSNNMGSISGYTVNEYKQPVSAEVFIASLEKTSMAEQNGYFQLDNIPPGDYFLIVGYQYVGTEYPITVKPGANISMGELQVPESHKPYE